MKFINIIIIFLIERKIISISISLLSKLSVVNITVIDTRVERYEFIKNNPRDKDFKTIKKLLYSIYIINNIQMTIHDYM